MPGNEPGPSSLQPVAITTTSRKCCCEDNIKISLKERDMGWGGVGVGWGWGGVVWTGLLWLRMGPVAGSCKQSNGLSGSIKVSEILEQLSD
jgi:hypothetical protein